MSEGLEKVQVAAITVPAVVPLQVVQETVDPAFAVAVSTTLASALIDVVPVVVAG
jgi:hypothetical protein